MSCHARAAAVPLLSERPTKPCPRLPGGPIRSPPGPPLPCHVQFCTAVGGRECKIPLGNQWLRACNGEDDTMQTCQHARHPTIAIYINTRSPGNMQLHINTATCKSTASAHKPAILHINPATCKSTASAHKPAMSCMLVPLRPILPERPTTSCPRLPGGPVRTPHATRPPARGDLLT